MWVEGGTARLSTLAFGAGMVGYGLEVVGQAPQVTLTLPAQSGRSPESAAVLTDLGYAMIAIANLPLAVMFAAVAVVSLRTGAFPAWLGGSRGWPRWPRWRCRSRSSIREGRWHRRAGQATSSISCPWSGWSRQ